ncbi:hypothetical protein RFI_17146, partial [Reticulomyxa filosa]
PIEVAALMLHLQEKKTTKRLLVAVLHLKSAKDAPGEKVRLKQLSRVLPDMKCYQEEKEKELKMNIPLFIGVLLIFFFFLYCSCFYEKVFQNKKQRGTKDFEPFAYASIISSEVMNALFESHNKSVSKEEDKLDPKQFAYSEKWGVNLSSAYSEALSTEPDYTSWKKRKDGIDKYTVDYIFFQKSKVSLVSYLEIPSEKEVNQSTFLPGWEYPSDHFSLMATFEF